MMFTFVPLTMDLVDEIDAWDYEGFFEQVVMTPYYESHSEEGKLKGPGGCEGYAALLDGKTAGLFEFTPKKASLEIGLALKPEWIGRGFGVTFVRDGIAFGLQQYEGIRSVTLTVSVENEPAVTVYKKAGFSIVREKAGEVEMEKVMN
ncbi:GNAT family N-acetyltransferase [Halobacillus litoralis]|uniref:GNAT family N-acetyltransferase n=1 Tax=Halobacillus litoralis TaxID=45668 RepID=UPI001CD205E1|nr:GNAT family N-acetyltransferase [Halobacillus litoralis]MCA1023827.1 GNAT family N-acetyltransferase [Halobacillus litoralis]